MNFYKNSQNCACAPNSLSTIRGGAANMIDGGEEAGAREKDAGLWTLDAGGGWRLLLALTARRGAPRPSRTRLGTGWLGTPQVRGARQLEGLRG